MLKQDSSLMTSHLTMEIEPAFTKNNIPVVFSSDQNYALYTGVTIKSLIDNSRPEYSYDICILDGGITSIDKNQILSLMEGRCNISIRFIDIQSLTDQIGTGIFHVPEMSHFSQANYYRFFLPKIFKNFSKVVYLDSDLILLEDISDFYFSDIGEKLFGAVKDFPMEILRNTYKEHDTYLRDVLGMRDTGSYFNTGVLLCNVVKMIEEDFTRKCLDRLMEIRSPTFVDQCVINSFTEGDIYFFDLSWNFMVNAIAFEKRLLMRTANASLEKLMEAYGRPKIIHYASDAKPWKRDSCQSECAHYWWYYANRTPFLNQFLKQLITITPESSPARVGAEDAPLRKTKVALFGIPILKIIRKPEKTSFRLFGFIPIAKIIRKV